MNYGVLDARRPQVVPLHNPCFECSSRTLCLPCNLSPEQHRRLSGIIQPTRTYRRGEPIYRMGDAFQSLFIVQSGSVKTQQLTVEGTSNITGFYLEGELFGLDAIGSKTCPCEAVAARTTNLCEIPFFKLEALCCDIPKVQSWLFGRLGERLKAQEAVSTWTTRKQIETRVLSFFLDLHQRMAVRERPTGGFLALPIQKCDIALYLKMTPETFSRTLTVLRSRGWLEIRGGRFQLPDLDVVKNMVGE